MNDFISFPALNLKFGISDTIFSFRLFGVQLELRWYGLLIAIGFLLAVVYAMRRVKQFDIDSDRMIDVVLVCAIFAFLGARIYYVLFAPDRADFFDNPLSILQVWKGGLAVYGGIIFAFITAIWMCRVRKVNTLSMFDLGSLGFLIGQSIGRWGNFFNQEAFGGNTSLPWGMTGSIIQRGINGEGYDPSLPVHPTFLYESLWNIFIFILLLSIRKRNKVPGRVFAWYLLLYSLGRFMTEFMRVDDFQSVNNVRYNQAFAAVIFLGAFIFLIIAATRQRARKRNPVYDTPSAYADILNTMKDEENLQQEVDSNDTEPVLSDNENRETASDPIPEADVEKPVEAGKANIAETGDNNEIVSPEPSDD